MAPAKGGIITQQPKNQQKRELQPPTSWSIWINPFWALDHGVHATNILGILDLSKKVFFFFFNKNIRSRCLENNTSNLNVPWSIPIDEDGDADLET